MEIKEEDVLFFKNPIEFFHWLRANHDRSSYVWIQIYKKASGKSSITYDEAVDVGLCFGWIDGIAKKYMKSPMCNDFLRDGPKAIGQRQIEKKQNVLSKKAKCNHPV